MMSQEDLSDLLYRLSCLETSIYRYRCNRLRMLILHQQAIADRLEKEFKDITYHTDGNFHHLSKELRSVKKYLKSKLKDSGLELPDESEPEFDLNQD